MSGKPYTDGDKTVFKVAEMINSVTKMIQDLNLDSVAKAATMIAKSNLVIAFGNGGSHAVASHLAGDIMLRPGPNFFTIGDNVVAHTAYANDYSFEESAALALERIVNSYGVDGDIKNNILVIVFSTSGESKNVMRIAKAAKARGCKVIAMLGKHLHRVEPYSDLIISVNGDKAGRIEVVHDAICHAIAEIVPTLMEAKE